MKKSLQKLFALLLVIVLISACNSSKRTQKLISKGNYDNAIKLSVKKLRKNRTSTKKQKQIVLLEDAFKKAVDQDNRSLIRYTADSNPAIIESIYETYIALDKRQELIRPLLPLFIKSRNKNAHFLFLDYQDKINSAKNSLTEYLYQNATNLLASNNKNKAKKAYEDLSYLTRINPNYKNVDELLEQAHFKGTNFINVALINDSNQIIPFRLEEDLLNFNSYGLDQFWTVFHSKIDPKIVYDYNLQLLFKRIDVNPEQIHEKQTLLEREIKDGFEYVLDENGNVATDSLGNSIKIDKYITVSADYFEIHQEKASHIEAEVVLINLKTNQEIDVIPLESEFIFIHDFAEMSGDIRALDQIHKDLIKLHEVPFPTSEQMIFDTGEDLKNKLREIIDDLAIE